MDLAKEGDEYYSKLAGWRDYVAPLINLFKKIHWERIEALANSELMQSIVLWRSRSFDNYEKTEALAREDFFDLNKYDSNRSRMYVAERLKRICCSLGAYENQRFLGPEGYFEVKTWRPADTFVLVINGNRDPNTVGKALAQVDWFRHCLHEFEQCEQTVSPAIAGNFETVYTGDRWAGLLINYTLADLNNLLVVAGLLETAAPPTVAAGTKAGQWVAVAAALYKGKRTLADKAALHRAFRETYGPAVGSLSSFSREYNESNEAARLCYSRALSWLG